MTTVNETTLDTIVTVITDGPQGPAGPGVPTGGTTGQVLVKVSNTNYDTTWVTSGVSGTDLSYTAATRLLESSTGTDVTLPLATTTDAGLESAADKIKLDSITVDTATVVRKYVRNNSGVSIPKGAAVYQTGSSGTTLTVALANASVEATAAQTIGLAQETIANNANGYVVAVGLLDGISTVSLTEGQIVWLSETAGQLTTTRPTQPAHGVVCGYCVKQSSGTSGILYVKVDNGLELEELHDVLVTGATTGQVLYKAADGLWKPKLLDGTNLANTTVTPGSYNLASLTVDAQGRVTAASSGSAPGTDLTYTAGTRLLASSTGADVTLPLVTSTDAGLAPASGGGTANFLRADGTWAAAGGLPGGSNTQLQFNDSGSFGGDADLTYNKTTNALTIGGDVTLNDGGSFTTTLQTITPTANRTVSLPDATGTVALVAGSSGQLLWNNAGANAGASTLTYDGSILTSSGRFINSYNATASSPAKAFTGTWFTGGTATTTKPHVLVEPTGTTSTAWSTSGTGLGVNAASGFAGNLLDLQVNGTSNFRVGSSGAITSPSINLGNCSISVTNSFGPDSGVGFQVNGGLKFRFSDDSGAVRFGLASNALLQWNASDNANLTNPSLVLARDAAGTLAQRNGTNAQAFRVYNTYTSGTNYELGKLEWNSNVFRIGTEKGSGGGTARTVEVHTDSVSRLAVDTTGSVRVVTGLTVATLPGTPTVGMIARVTDASAPAVGSTVAGGGSAAALCWYNGTNWTVLGV